MNETHTQSQPAIQFGDSAEQRLAVALAAATALHARGHVAEYGWRAKIAREVARWCGLEKQFVYGAIGNLGGENLRKVHAAFLGETLPASEDGKKGGEQPPTPEPGEDSEPEDNEKPSARALRIRASYESAIKGLSLDSRNRNGLVKAMNLPSMVVDSYLYQNRDLAAQLSDGGDIFGQSSLSRKSGK